MSLRTHALSFISLIHSKSNRIKKIILVSIILVTHVKLFFDRKQHTHGLKMGTSFEKYFAYYVDINIFFLESQAY